MRLLTPRLLIRSLAPADIEPLVALWTDPEVTRHLGGPRDADKVRSALQATLAAPSAVRRGSPDPAAVPTEGLHSSRKTCGQPMGGVGDPRPTFDLWPVVLRSDAAGPPLGECGLLAKDIDGVAEIELVYILAAHAWGQGYATEAGAALRDYALVELGLPRLVALIEPDHTASARVAAKLGLHRARQTIRPSGRVMDLYVLERKERGHSTFPPEK